MKTKCIFTLLIALCTNTIWAQFPFTTEKTEVGWECEMERGEQFNNDLILLTWRTSYDPEFNTVAVFDFYGDENFKVLGRRLTERDENGQRIASEQTVTIDLSNGERLTFDDEMIMDENEDQEVENIYAYSLHLFFEDATSNKVNIGGLSEAQISNYVATQLSNYDITCMTFLGWRFPFTKIRTAPTFREMFITLGQKTGHSLINRSNRSTQRVSTGISAEFKRAWLELNVYQNDQKGLRIHANLDVRNARGKDMRMECYFFDGNGRPLKDYNQKYHSTDGQVSVYASFIPRYDSTNFSDLSVFIPYSELHLSSGQHSIECRATISDEDYRYAEYKGLSFTIQ